MKRVLRDPETQTKIVELVPAVETAHEHKFSYDRLNAVWRCACSLTRAEVPPPAMRRR